MVCFMANTDVAVEKAGLSGRISVEERIVNGANLSGSTSLNFVTPLPEWTRFFATL